MSLSKICYSLLLVFLQVNAFAQVVLTNNTTSKAIGKELQILTPSEEISIEEALNSKAFLTQENDVPNLGIQKHSVWLKFFIKNRSDAKDFLLDVEYAILDSVQLFEIDSNNKILNTVNYGEAYPFFARKYLHPNFIFDIQFDAQEKKIFIFRIKSSEQLILPISINTSKSLWERISKENTLSGIYLGIILIMIFYNLFIFFSVRDKGYLFYVVYVLFIGLTQLGIKGFTYQYLWPDYPPLQSKGLTIFASISCIATILFTNYFLQLKETAKRARYPLNFLLILFISSIGITLFGNVQVGFQLMLIATSIETFLLLFISFYVMIKGFKPAIYFFSAWFILLIGSLIFLLKDFGILPYNIYTSYCFQAASAIEMALLSFGLANRINILKKEKAISQLQALQASKENEKIVSQQNVLLEQKVIERTHKLNEINENLNTTLENLKQTQTQLVEAEKMASLGQLTAGIAHEINNPINFVTGNITPLKRDVDMIFETIDFVESVGLMDISEAEKKQKIKEYKDDLEYDYLKEEISHLLDGIYEGSSRTAEIVKGLRIFSRIDESDLKYADINEGLDSTLIIINNLLSSSINIDKKYDAKLPLIECFPGKLNQVFLNILSNSIHAIRAKFVENKGGIISIITVSEQDNIVITIADNGTGMSEETMHKIFEPFFTTKEVGEGTGLGMSIVYNTIKKHNGDINIQSELGAGSTFVITLPKKFTPTIEE